MASLVLAALALGGCGRKGGLQLPPAPTAQAAPVSAAPATVVVEEDEGLAAPAPNPVYEATPDVAPAAAAKGRKKTFVLDPLLGN